MGKLISDYLKYNNDIYKEIDVLDKKEIDKYILKYFSGIEINIKKPLFVMTAGISGSGKSTFYDRYKNTFPNHGFISGDKIMHNLSIFKELKKQNIDDPVYFKTSEMVSRKIMFFILDRLLENKSNIFIDNGALDDNKKNMIKFIKNIFPHKIIVNFITINEEIAIERVIKRHYENNGGYIPINLIKNNINKVNSSIEFYKSFVDELNVYDHNSDEFILVNRYCNK